MGALPAVPEVRAGQGISGTGVIDSVSKYLDAGFVHSTFSCSPDSDFILLSELGSPLKQSPAENSLHSPDLPLKLRPVMNHCAQALLHCVQWCITVLVSPHSHQHLLLSVFFIMPTLESVK